MDRQGTASPLSRSNAHFANPRGSDLTSRLGPYAAWTDARIDGGYWPYARTLETPPAPEASIAYVGAERGRRGVNLAVQDYLALSTDPRIADAARQAIRDFGVHSAGSAMLLGNNPLSLRLERLLCDFVQMEHVLLFPTGWAAGFGTVKGLVRDYDHIVLDSLSHACLQEGAAAATRNIHRYRHLDIDHAEQLLRSVRASDGENGVLVVAESLYSMDSDTPDLERLQTLCRELGATLLVDAAHDLGALGPGGAGMIAAQGLAGRVDLVMGAFSKTFASNGGFVATNDARVKAYLRWFANPHTFSNALSPIQCAVVAEAIRIVASADGDELRTRLRDAATYFREELGARGLTVLGEPSAIVPVLLGKEPLARVASRAVARSGTFANLVEFPAVGLGAARFRCQLMATHTKAQLRAAATDIAAAVAQASETTDAGEQ